MTGKKDLQDSLKKLKEWDLIGEQAGFSIPKSQLSEQEKEVFSGFLKENGILYMRGGRSSKCYSLESKAFYALYNAMKLQKFYDLFTDKKIFEKRVPVEPMIYKA